MNTAQTSWRDRIEPDPENEAIECPACGEQWILTKRNRDWFLAKRLSVPRRCEACRKAGRETSR